MDALMTADVFQSPAVGILCALRADGFRVEIASDGTMSIAPRSRLTPERMQAIAACKDGIRLPVGLDALTRTAHLSVRDAAQALGVSRSVLHRARVSRKPVRLAS